jgi:hypothetical protein
VGRRFYGCCIGGSGIRPCDRIQPLFLQIIKLLYKRLDERMLGQQKLKQEQDRGGSYQLHVEVAP